MKRKPKTYTTQKYGAWTVPGSRETARIAWRARVDAAARAYRIVAYIAPGDIGAHLTTDDMKRISRAWARPHRIERRMHPRYQRAECRALSAALTAPRPWRSTRRPDPRRRYSRAHRRACDGCRKAWRVTVMCGMRNGVGEMWTAYGWVDPTGCAATMRRDPHGRRS